MTGTHPSETSIVTFLKENEVAFKLKPHQNPVYTSEDAARERGVKLCQIVKTMILISKDGDTFVAVLPGDKRLDLKKAKKLIGKKDLTLMSPERVANTFGFTVGAIAPIGNTLSRFPFLVDPSVFMEKYVDISSGHPEAGIELKSADLKTLLEDALVESITK
jgi:Cys-tRNA(Pro) deacylase